MIANTFSVVTNIVLICCLLLDIYMVLRMEKNLAVAKAEREEAMRRHSAEIHELRVQMADDHASHIQSRMKELTGAP
jgi:uncharacterized protein YbcI